MDPSPATIFIVDDDAQICQALARLLRTAHYETRTFGSAVEFLAAHDPQPAGCILLDLLMPELDGLEVQALLAAAGSRRPIIFLTGNGSISTSVTALRAGAVDYLTKPVEDHHLFRAIEEALAIDAEERRRSLLRQTVMERLSTLTPRERQVLECVVTGRLNKQIAADLGTVEKTIKVHRARVMHKMGAHSLAELVRLATSGEVLAEPVSLGAPSREIPQRIDMRARRGAPLRRTRSRLSWQSGQGIPWKSLGL